MTAAVYKEMLTVMQNRRGPYAGMDIPEFYALVEALFTPEQAEINNALTRKPATAVEIAEQMGKPEDYVVAHLEVMADAGLCTTFVSGDRRYYGGAAFMPGIFEFQFLPGRVTDHDKKIARLIHAYKEAFTRKAGASKLTFPVTRVIPVDRTINAGNTIHTYDQVQTYIDKYDTIGVGTCFCRHAAYLRGEDTHDMPMNVCFWFGRLGELAVERLGGRRLSKAEAREILDQTEEAGLIHMSRNTTEEIDFICNCDRWHCEVVTEVLKQPKPALFFNSGYEPCFDAALCAACGTCIDRCPPEALAMGEAEVPEVDLDRCFGCAVCATGCPEEAITMEAKPGWETPPKTVKDLIGALKASASSASR